MLKFRHLIRMVIAAVGVILSASQSEAQRASLTSATSQD